MKFKKFLLLCFALAFMVGISFFILQVVSNQEVLPKIKEFFTDTEKNITSIFDKEEADAAHRPTSRQTKDELPSDKPTPTGTQTDETESKPTPTPKPSPTEKASQTQNSSSNPKPSPTEKASQTQNSSSNPKPTPTSTPTKKTSPTPETSPRDSLTEAVKKMKQVMAEIPNAVMQAELFQEEAELNEYVRRAAEVYCEFGFLAESWDILHAPEEYRSMYPEISSMSVKKIEKYNNGIYVVFQNVSSVYDYNVRYAIRTGNTQILTKEEAFVYQEINRIYQKLNKEGASEIEQVKAAHDYIILNTAYTEGSVPEEAHTPYGLLKNHSAVCDGYARTFQLLMQLFGIRCEIVNGDSDGGAHSWNMVCLNDLWYQLDVTWDDPTPNQEGVVSYEFFMKTDDFFARRHAWSSYYSCTDTTYEIYGYQDYLCMTTEEAKTRIEEQLLQQPSRIQLLYRRDGVLKQQELLNLFQDIVKKKITYYPEKEIGEYYLLQLVNPEL